MLLIWLNVHLQASEIGVFLVSGLHYFPIPPEACDAEVELNPQPSIILTTAPVRRIYCFGEFGGSSGMLSVKNWNYGIADFPILSPRPLICHCYLGGLGQLCVDGVPQNNAGRLCQKVGLWLLTQLRLSSAERTGCHICTWADGVRLYLMLLLSHTLNSKAEEKVLWKSILNFCNRLLA